MLHIAFINSLSGNGAFLNPSAGPCDSHSNRYETIYYTIPVTARLTLAVLVIWTSFLKNLRKSIMTDIKKLYSSYSLSPVRLLRRCIHPYRYPSRIHTGLQTDTRRLATAHSRLLKRYKETYKNIQANRSSGVFNTASAPPAIIPFSSHNGVGVYKNKESPFRTPLKVIVAYEIYARNPRRIPAATALPITPATFGPIACISKWLFLS